ncbi:MAG TPA: efflux RND transporter periplasmic adaptor subunit [Pyrinomonadaceae bacterium]|nr:efflux RND transporter periplasmic adaptor subunit [Pyrinomonadaceae bacterium]
MGRTALKATIILSVLIAGGCGSGNSDRGGRANSNAEENPQAAVAITVGKSESRDIAASIQATGTVAADETSDVAPKVAGKIANLSVDAGQFVSGGAVIARIDDRDARLQLAAAQAAVKKARVTVTQAEARLGLGPNGNFIASNIPEVRAAAANHEQAVAELRQAEANEKRYRELTQSGDVAMITYETFRTTRDTARTRANAARQQLDVAINAARQNNQAIAAAKADVETAQTQVDEAQQAIADTVVRAPFSGFVSSRPVAVGEFVSSASIVATILRTNPIKVQIQVAEADLPYVGLGRGVSVEIDAYKDRKFAGTVTSVNPAVDPVSRSAIVEASIQNGDNALRPGMFATVRINKEGGGKGIFIPKTAVHNDQATQSYRAFVIVEGVAKLRVIQLGPEEGDSIQILNGINADEVVATSNLEQLYEGARVAF